MSAEQNSGQELPEELKAIEAALRQLTPRGTIDRDRLIYLAGRASATHADAFNRTIRLGRVKTFVERHLWPMATAALALVSVTLGGLLLRGSRSEPPRVYVALPQVGNEDQSHAGWVNAGFVNLVAQPMGTTSNYLQLRNFVLTHGNGALPATPAVNNLNNPSHQSPLPTLQHPWFGDES